MSAKNQSRLVFLKFGKKDHLCQLVSSGEVFCNTFEYFKKKEQKSQRYDQDEFIDHYHQPEDVTRITISNREFQVVGPVKLTIGSVHYTHIFCLTAVYIDDLQDGGFIYSDKSWKNFDGEHVVLIYDASEFIRRLRAEAENQGLRCQWQPVEYVDSETYSGEMGPFRKFNGFAWQQEYRIAIFHAEKFDRNQAVSLKLGALEDIATGPVHRSKCINRVVGQDCRI